METGKTFGLTSQEKFSYQNRKWEDHNTGIRSIRHGDPETGNICSLINF